LEESRSGTRAWVTKPVKRENPVSSKTNRLINRPKTVFGIVHSTFQKKTDHTGFYQFCEPKMKHECYASDESYTQVESKIHHMRNIQAYNIVLEESRAAFGSLDLFWRGNAKPVKRSASTKHGFVGPLIFALKCENWKSEKNHDFSGQKMRVATKPNTPRISWRSQDVQKGRPKQLSGRVQGRSSFRSPNLLRQV
jgi:hypothetical protein